VDGINWQRVLMSQQQVGQPDEQGRITACGGKQACFNSA
jgi:hypothetical protein